MATTKSAARGGASATVTANVRVLMALNRQSHDEVAAALLLSRPSLSARLNGHTSWTLGDVDQLAAFYGLEPAALLTPPAASLQAQVQAQLDAAGRRPRRPYVAVRNRRPQPGELAARAF